MRYGHREAAATFYRALLHRSARRVRPVESDTSALIFAPHPDDDILACGGTMAKKSAAGARVHVAYMTDGSRSHQGLMAPSLLKRVRTEEAFAATRVLGIPPSRLIFLQFADRALRDHARHASAIVAALVARLRPSEIYAPIRNDGHPDHIATNAIVFQALESLRRRPPIF